MNLFSQPAQGRRTGGTLRQQKAFCTLGTSSLKRVKCFKLSWRTGRGAVPYRSSGAREMPHCICHL